MPDERAFHDVSWLAVRGDVQPDLLDALGLAEPREVSWEQGLAAVLRDYWDPDLGVDTTLSRVFAFRVPARDWCCLVGGWFADSEDDARVVEACVLASRLRGEACAFTTQNRMDFYAWMTASAGSLVRRFLWDGEPIVNDGVWAPEENWNRVGSFHENTICTLASRYAAGPDECGGSTPKGLLAITPAGRTPGRDPSSRRSVRQ